MVNSMKSEEKLNSAIQQEYKILAEYKMVESERISGVYVIPSYENSLLWFGVIFVRSGFYIEGVFRFNIFLPDEFPSAKELPTIIFQNEIFHPLICPFKHTLDLTNAFPFWKEGDDHIWHILKYIKCIFLDPWESLKGNQFLNQEAVELLSQNRAEFIRKAKDCVTENAKHIYDEPPTNDPHYISFEMYNKDIHETVLDNIKKNKDFMGSSVPLTGLSWVKDGEFKPLSKD